MGNAVKFGDKDTGHDSHSEGNVEKEWLIHDKLEKETSKYRLHFF